MQLSDFHYDLPQALIAQHPPEQRGTSRLLVCQQHQAVQDALFTNIAHVLRPGDTLVLNNTKVLKARLYATKPTGGKVELLIERIEADGLHFTAMLRASHPPKPGSVLYFGSDAQTNTSTVATVLGKEGPMFSLCWASSNLHSLFEWLETQGTLPLPPYITHEATASDETRYQTVFAKSPGAVAAPTAGLHFTEALLQELSQQGITIVHLTLHVGAGTFLPVKVDDINQHVMHSERYHITASTLQALVDTKRRHGRIVAVGTTSLRAMEAWGHSQDCNLNTAEGLDKAQQQINQLQLNITNQNQNSSSQAHAGDTRIFIRPGHPFFTVDALLTNFHLPQSTLLMLVSAFYGREPIMQAYQHAITQAYRFFSYGDAMWLEPPCSVRV
jgi:S-adenosylmethionine:tRNA ribosyltransferase-isomerase